MKTNVHFKVLLGFDEKGQKEKVSSNKNREQ